MSDPGYERDATFAPAPGVYARAFGDELVLLHFASGEYFGVDAVGAEIWRALEGGETLAATAARVSAIWDVDENRAFRDIAVLVRDLSDMELLAPR